VVPVFGAAPALRLCLASLGAPGAAGDGRFLLVLDGPQPADVELVLGEASAAPGVRFEVLRQPERRGFAAAANAGIAASAGDVVLLNSDTEVTAGWLEKLRDAAYTAPEVASATPFSNSATLCSIPRWLEENALPAGFTVESFGRLVEGCSLRQRPTIPTGVGFCMFLKRQALAEVGPLDVAGFGLGYGEEVDWCFRAADRGWRHVLDDATFVYHAGQASFGAVSGAKVRRANRLIRRRYPEAWRRLSDFIRLDPLAPLRRRVIDRLRPAPALSAPRPGRVLHVVHGWPPWNHAGTELYAARLGRWQAQRRAVSALARISHPGRELGDAIELLDHGVRVRLLVNNFTQRNPLSRAAIREPVFERAFGRLLQEEKPDLVHVHHLAGLCASLPSLARRQGVPIVYQVQDWWTVCARANLLDDRRRLCSGPGLAKCSRCLPLTALAPAALTNRWLHFWRRRAFRRALRSADAWIMGSRFIESSLRGFKLLNERDAVHVLPYGVDPPASCAQRAPHTGPLRVGFVGSLLPHKGALVAVEAFAGIAAETATLEVWGDPSVSPAYFAELQARAGNAVRFQGSFAEGEEAALFSRLDALVVPSLGLESYGIAPREAIAHGVFVLASRRGALAELAANVQQCAGFDPERPEELRRLILQLAADPGWQSPRAASTKASPTLEEHALAIEGVYEAVLSRRSEDR
jgi:glycosyltransferase involved in cell wall biosynthesis